MVSDIVKDVTWVDKFVESGIDKIDKKVQGVSVQDATDYVRDTNEMRAIAKEEVQNAARDVHLNADQARVYEVNVWISGKNLIPNHSVFITKDLPILFRMSRIEGKQIYTDFDLQMFKTPQSEIPFIKDSIAMFAEGALSIQAMLQSSGYSKQFKHDPEKLYKGKLKFEHYTINIDGSIQGYDYEPTTNLGAYLLEIMIDIFTNCRTIVQQPALYTYGDAVPDSDVLTVLRGKRFPENQPPHLLVGLGRHRLNWFVTNVNNIITEDDIQIGTTNYSQDAVGVRAKLSDWVWTTIDAMAATLYTLTQIEQERKLLTGNEYQVILNSFAALDSIVAPLRENYEGIIRIEGLTSLEVDVYKFCFVLFPNLRSMVYSKLEDMVTRMGGLSIISTDDAIRVISDGYNNLMVNDDIRKSIRKCIRGISQKHVLQSMVLDKVHHFTAIRLHGGEQINDLITAINVAISVFIQALTVPCVFWRNVNEYAIRIWNFFLFLGGPNFVRMQDIGFSPNKHTAMNITFIEMLQGEISNIFTYGNYPAQVRQFIECLAPLGAMERVPCAANTFTPFISTNVEVYNPSTYVGRPRMGIQPETEFSNRFRRFLELLIALVNNYKVRNALSTQFVTPVLGYLSTLRVLGCEFGQVFHNELYYIRRRLNELPYVPYESYSGLAAANISPLMAVYSMADQNGNVIPALDTNQVVYLHEGLFALFCVKGVNVAKNQMIVPVDETIFNFINPRSIYIDYYDMVKALLPIGEGLALFYHIIAAGDRDQGPFAGFLLIYGRGMKAGAAITLLNYIIGQSELGKLLLYNNTAITVDQRMRNPGLCLVDGILNIQRTPPPLTRDLNRALLLLSEERNEMLNLLTQLFFSNTSPFLHIHRGLIVSYELKELFDPYALPRADYAQVIVFDRQHFDDFGILLDNGRNIPFVVVNGVRHSFLHRPDFPVNIRVQMDSGLGLLREVWDLLKLAVINKGWQLYFPNLISNVKIYRPPAPVRINDDMSLFNWDNLYSYQVGTILSVTLIDTKHITYDTRVDISTGNVVQSIYMQNLSERDRLMGDIIDVRGPTEGYVPPNYENWCVGRLLPDTLPQFDDGVLKVLREPINFNNGIRIYTSNVTFDNYPEVTYVAPDPVFYS
uniref:Uncharacterized protein n=1 Tax=French Guiana reovirus TaxID=2803189 RepID=A0A7T8G1Y0_9REOV|nr:hypothetical protein [French Guiana reovirus]